MKTILFGALSILLGSLDAYAGTTVVPYLPARPRRLFVLSVGLNETPVRPAGSIRGAENDARSIKEAFEAVRDSLESSREDGNTDLFIAAADTTDMNTVQNPVADAMALKDVLERVYGFHVELCKDLKHDKVLRKLEEYQKRSFKPDDQLVIFFAGHGSYMKNLLDDGVIVTSDSPKEITTETLGHFIPMSSQLRTVVDNIGSNHVLLILDTCHGGAALGSRTKRASLGLTSPYRLLADARDLMPLDERLFRMMKTRTRKAITPAGAATQCRMALGASMHRSAGSFSRRFAMRATRSSRWTPCISISFRPTSSHSGATSPTPTVTSSSSAALCGRRLAGRSCQKCGLA